MPGCAETTAALSRLAHGREKKTNNNKKNPKNKIIKRSECQQSTETPLAEIRFEARRCRTEEEGRGCGGILHPSRHKRLALTLFRRFVCLPPRRRERLRLHVHL